MSRRPDQLRQEQVLLFLVDGPLTRWELVTQMLDHPHVPCNLVGQAESALAFCRHRGLVEREQVTLDGVPRARWRITDRGRERVAANVRRIRAAQLRRHAPPPPPRDSRPRSLVEVGGSWNIETSEAAP